MDLRTVKGERAPLALLSIHGSPCLLSGSSLSFLTNPLHWLVMHSASYKIKSFYPSLSFAEYNSRREAGEEISNFLVSKGVGPLMALYSPSGPGPYKPISARALKGLI